MLLKNPEREWVHQTPPLERAEVEARLGATDEPLTLMAGGLSNRNVRVGRDRVLRIFRDPSIVGKEAALLSRAWRTFRSPTLVDRGGDWLLVEHVAHTPLADRTDEGAAAGRALAEIHSHRYAAVGFLDDDLALARPLAGGSFTARGYGSWELSRVASHIEPSLCARLREFFESDELAARDAVDVPVLAHCDFKASNLHWTTDNELLVLDWEFAWAGPRYIDIGQLLRWHPPEPFVRAFADAYVAGGGVLADDWRRFAETIDLCGLVSLYRNPAARVTDDLRRRILETIDR